MASFEEKKLRGGEQDVGEIGEGIFAIIVGVVDEIIRTLGRRGARSTSEDGFM
jgi:hypothetical protein